MDGVFVKILYVDLLAADLFDLFGVNLEICSVSLFTLPDLPVETFLDLFFRVAPPVTLAFPVLADYWSFLRALTPFSCLKIVTMSTVGVFPSLNPYWLKVLPEAKLIMP